VVSKARFRFYEELNDFLPQKRRKTEFGVSFESQVTIQEMIQALGVPHTMVDLVLVNGRPADFGHLLREGDRVSVYPVFESLNIESVSRLRKRPLRRTKFVADADLGDTAEYMQALGFDIHFDPSLSPGEIVDIAKRESRIILTQRKKPFELKEITHCILLERGAAEEQVKKIMDYLDIQ
jgi:hypothetical protein